MHCFNHYTVTDFIFIYFFLFILFIYLFYFWGGGGGSLVFIVLFCLTTPGLSKDIQFYV